MSEKQKKLGGTVYVEYGGKYFHLNDKRSQEIPDTSTTATTCSTLQLSLLTYYYNIINY